MTDTSRRQLLAGVAVSAAAVIPPAVVSAAELAIPNAEQARWYLAWRLNYQSWRDRLTFAQRMKFRKLISRRLGIGEDEFDDNTWTVRQRFTWSLEDTLPSRVGGVSFSGERDGKHLFELAIVRPMDAAEVVARLAPLADTCKFAVTSRRDLTDAEALDLARWLYTEHPEEPPA